MITINLTINRTIRSKNGNEFTWIVGLVKKNSPEKDDKLMLTLMKHGFNRVK